LLTFLVRAGRRADLRAVVTCRSDEAPVEGHILEWLAHVRRSAGVEEIRIRPLSRGETAEQITSLATMPLPVAFVDRLYARTEGNPFFTEQLAAAALSGRGDGEPASPALPARLAEALDIRVARCGPEALEVLSALAVATRPLSEEALAAITVLSSQAVRAGLRELAAARLLADTFADALHRIRHALLAEAVTAGLLPGERALLHARTAQAMEAADDTALAAEIAGHWAAAGRPAEELPARVAAADAAEQLFGYAEAAAHWQRAIDLSAALPTANIRPGLDVATLYVRCADGLELSGNGETAGQVAEEAYRRFADDPNRLSAALVCHRAAVFRMIVAPATGLPPIEAALRLFEQDPPSADYAEALFDYARVFLPLAGKNHERQSAALTRALEVAELAGASVLIPRILAVLSNEAFIRGRIQEGRAILKRGWAAAEASPDGVAQVWLAVSESGALLQLGEYDQAATVATQYLEAARDLGLGAWFLVTLLACNAAEALLAAGRTADAAMLIDPLTNGPPDRDHYPVHLLRVEIDILRGDLQSAGERRQLIQAILTQIDTREFGLYSAWQAAELAVWSGHPGEAADEVQRALPQVTAFDQNAFSGRLLTTGMRACADLAERARARRDQSDGHNAAAAAADLAEWVKSADRSPFADHPLVAAIPAERASWHAERARLIGASDPAAWNAAARAWESLGCPHRAGYAWWRHCQALLDAGQPSAAAEAALQAAAAAADGHAPLLGAIRKLAARARIQTPSPATLSPPAPQTAKAPATYGLTARELAVLGLLAAGRTNAQIGAELFISPKTASVHVTNILRKLGVETRVQAAAVAERADLLPRDNANTAVP
jgi:DNA-binding CsgD family transcriptional regulator